MLSGKDKFTKEENILLKANKVDCYDKTKPSDVERLFDHMKKSAIKQPDTQLKYKFAGLLEICSEDLIGNNIYSRLFDLIKHIEDVNKITGGEDMLTSMRKIIEGLFSTLGKYQIIPNEIVGVKGWINGSSLFLSGKHRDYQITEDIIPSIVGFSIHKLLDVLQDGSHAYGDLKYKVDSYIKKSRSDYFIRSCIYSLFDILIFFKKFINENSDKTINQTKWEAIANKSYNSNDWILGTVERIAENGWGTFKSESGNEIGIPPYTVNEKKLQEGDKISVVTKPSGKKTHIVEINKQ